MVKAKLNLIFMLVMFTLVFSLSGCGASLSPGKVMTVDAFIVVDDVELARYDIESSGGRMVHIFPEDKVMMGKLPINMKSKYISEIYYDGEDKTPSENLELYNIWVKNLDWKKMSVEDRMIGMPENVEPLINDIFVEEIFDLNDLDYNAKSAPEGAGPLDTSLYMAGNVIVGVVFPESNGGSEDWTDVEILDVKSEIMAAMDWWAEMNDMANLAFQYDWNERIPVTLEPIEGVSGLRNVWGSQALAYMGYGDGSAPVTDDVYDYLNAIRDSSEGVDWAFLFFVVDSSNDADGEFSDGRFAFAVTTTYGDGIYSVMTYNNSGYGIENMDTVAAHETGHIFGAQDQYTNPTYQCSCTPQTGYLYVENQNCDNSCSFNDESIMKWPLTAYPEEAVDEYARGQIGWQDDEGDGILDILGNPIEMALSDIEMLVKGNGSLDYNGTAEISVYPAVNPYYNNVSIDLVNNIQYIFAPGGSLEDASGDFDLPLVDYYFSITDDLDWGEYLVTAFGFNRFGQNQSINDSVSVFGCEDDDGGKNYTEPAEIRNFNGTFNNAEDYCIGPGVVKEYYCGENGYSIESEEHFCGIREFCRNGECVRKYKRIDVRPMSIPVPEGRF